MARYVPPVQSKIGQLIDVGVILVLTIGTLYLPSWLGLSGSSKVANTAVNPT